MIRIPLRFLTLSLSIGLIIAGCSSQPKTITGGKSPEQEIKPLSVGEQYLQDAKAQTSETQKNRYYLNAAQAFLEQGYYTQAQHALQNVQTQSLTSDKLSTYNLTLIETSLQTNNVETLKTTLDDLQVDSILRTSLSQQETIVRLLATAYSKINRPLDAAVLLSDYQGVFGYQQNAQVSEEIWLLLQRTELNDLVAFQEDGHLDNTIAWVDLARQLKFSTASIDEQYTLLTNWLNQNPRHPATDNLPFELEALIKLPESAPNKIILALPFSGQFENIGIAIAEGFLAANFNAQKSISIEAFDTNRQTIPSLYNQAIDNSPNTLIIGPVVKSNIQQLNDLTELPITTLALNSSDGALINDELYFFGLAPEHELAQIANRLIEQGLNRVAIIGETTSRGSRLTSTFYELFEKQGGNVVAQAAYGKETSLSDAVAALLSTDTSKKRSNAIARLTGLKLETRPERRRDIDAIVLLGNNQNAKRINPLFAFNFADDIPVFATSSIHEPNSTDTNNDLSGVQFIDIPWAFNKTDRIKLQIDASRKNVAAQYMRFYALGADAYALSPRLALLREIPNSFVQGRTGKLSIDDDGSIFRRLQWAKYQGGKAIPIN